MYITPLGLKRFYENWFSWHVLFHLQSCKAAQNVHTICTCASNCRLGRMKYGRFAKTRPSLTWILSVDRVWNVMAHAQKPDFVFRGNRRVHLNRQGASVQSTTGSWGVRISGSNTGYTMFRGSVKGTGYSLRSPFSSSLPLPYVTVCHHVSTRLYHSLTNVR